MHSQSARRAQLSDACRFQCGGSRARRQQDGGGTTLGRPLACTLLLLAQAPAFRFCIERHATRSSMALAPRPAGRDRPPTAISPSILSSDFARCVWHVAAMGASTCRRRSRSPQPLAAAAQPRHPPELAPAHRLAEECQRMVDLGADWLHVDVMVRP